MNEFLLYIQDGKINNPAKLNEFIRTAKSGRYFAKFQHISRRTLPQNAYLHGVLIPEFTNALRSVGYRVPEGYEKEIFKETFLKVNLESEVNGQMISYTKHTADLTKEEMSDLIDEVIQFCAENMNYSIPYPNEQLSAFNE